MTIIEKQWELQRKFLEAKNNPELLEKCDQFFEELKAAGFKGKFEIDAEVYHNCVGVSRSDLISLYQLGKAKWYHQKITNTGFSGNKATAVGSFLHALVLEPETIVDFVMDTELIKEARKRDFAEQIEKNEAKKKPVENFEPKEKSWKSTSAYRSVKELYELRGKIIIEGDVANELELAKKNILGCEIIKAYFRNGHAEESFFGIDPNTGLLVKARTDYRHPKFKVIIDYKTTAINSDTTWIRQANDKGLIVQQRLYPMVLEWAGEEKHNFVFIRTDTKEPFETTSPIILADMDETGKNKGTEDANKLLRNYLRALEADDWGLNQNINPIEVDLPAFVFFDKLSKEV